MGSIDNIVHSNDSILNQSIPLAGQLDDTETSTVIEDNVSTVRITPSRALHINLRNQIGTEIGTSDSPLRIDPTGTTAQPVTDNGGSLTVDNNGTFAVQATQSGTWIIQQRASSIDTYSASSLSVVPPATPTDMFTIYGSATKTIKVQRIEITTTQTTTGTNHFYLIKRSSANSGGTTSAQTPVPHDSNNAIATATVITYLSNPTTLGTTVGRITSRKVVTPAVGTLGIPLQSYEFTPSGIQPIVLRGTNEGLTLNFNGVALPAGLTFTAKVDWTEE